MMCTTLLQAAYISISHKVEVGGLGQEGQHLGGGRGEANAKVEGWFTKGQLLRGTGRKPELGGESRYETRRHAAP